MLLIVARKVTIFELEIDQRRIYMPRPERTASPSYFRLMLKNNEYLRELLLEIILVVPHPSILIVGQNYGVYS